MILVTMPLVVVFYNIASEAMLRTPLTLQLRDPHRRLLATPLHSMFLAVSLHGMNSAIPLLQRSLLDQLRSMSCC